jgi:hypothetical protein
MLEQWRNKAFTIDELAGFDVKNLLGQFCMVSVANDKGVDGKEYCNVKAVSPVPHAIKKAGLPDGYNQTVLFSLDDFDRKIYDSLSQKTRDRIASSPEYKKAVGNNLVNMKDDDPSDQDIPF